MSWPVRLDFDRAAGSGSRLRRGATSAILAAALFVVLAFGAYLDVPRLLTTPAGIIHGASNVDVAVRIPALRVLMVAALVGAALALYQTVAASWWPIISAAALYIVVTVGGFGRARR